MGAVSQFASPERSVPAELNRQKEIFEHLVEFGRVADFVPDPIMVLNNHRQIVFANEAASNLVRACVRTEPHGLRPGEALGCEYAFANACGCGTSSFCAYCGAVRAIMSSLRGEEDVQECRFTQKNSGDAFLFMVYTYPYEINTEQYSIFIVKDVTESRRMQILERVFFHDVRNTLTALYGWSDILKGASGLSEAREAGRMLTQLSGELIDEVSGQEQLVSATSNLLAVKNEELNSLTLLGEVAEVYRCHRVADGRSIAIAPEAEDVVLKSDALLLKRVLGNMVRNALEAVAPGQTVTMGCRRSGGNAEFWVHNPGIIADDVKPNIFKWSFSTKGRDRGLGTYGMRLLSERYLKGRVSFVSTPEGGTVFSALYPLRIGAAKQPRS
jgi:nitrogen-specific signal transduction histidine kinase